MENETGKEIAERELIPSGGKQKKEKPKKINVNRTLFIVAGLSLPILSFLVFWLYVNFSSFLLAFQEKNAITHELDWTTANFKTFWDELTRNGGQIGIALKNTLVYFVVGIVLLFLNLIASYFLYKKVFMYKSFRVIFYLPAIVSAVVMTMVFQEFIRPNGPLGIIMRSMGVEIDKKGLLGNAETATLTIVAYTVWTGFTNMILFHGSLARIPAEILEAAKLDGCGPFRECIQIVFPLIWPMFSTMLIFNMTSLFTAGGPVLLFMTEWEIVNTQSTTIPYWIFNQVAGTAGSVGGSGSYGLVSAAGLCFTLVGVPVIMGIRKLLDKVPVVEY